MSSFSTMFTNLLNIFNHDEQSKEKLEEASMIEYSNSAKETLHQTQKLNATEKQVSDDYCSFVINYYRSLGFTVWEYRKEKELEESEIHILIKKDHDIYLIQCRDDNQTLDKNNIRDFEEELEAFISEHQVFENYNVKLLYTMSSLQLDESAYKYIKSSNNIDYEILKRHSN